MNVEATLNLLKANELELSDSLQLGNKPSEVLHFIQTKILDPKVNINAIQE